MKGIHTFTHKFYHNWSSDHTAGANLHAFTVRKCSIRTHMTSSATAKKRQSAQAPSTCLVITMIGLVLALLTGFMLKSTYDAAIKHAADEIRPLYAQKARIMQNRLSLPSCSNKEVEIETGLQEVCEEARRFKLKHGDTEVLRQAMERVHGDIAEFVFEVVIPPLSSAVTIVAVLFFIVATVRLCSGHRTLLPL